MTEHLAMALANAYGRSEPEDRVDAIKTAVSNQLGNVDRSVEIRHTEYFNSSIAPDLVMRWPKENRERPVFLRSNPSLDWLSQDLAWISPIHPLFEGYSGECVEV